MPARLALALPPATSTLPFWRWAKPAQKMLCSEDHALERIVSRFPNHRACERVICICLGCLVTHRIPHQEFAVGQQCLENGDDLSADYRAPLTGYAGIGAHGSDGCVAGTDLLRPGSPLFNPGFAKYSRLVLRSFPLDLADGHGRQIFCGVFGTVMSSCSAPSTACSVALAGGANWASPALGKTNASNRPRTMRRRSLREVDHLHYD